MTETKPSLSYKDAGVDIEAGDALVDRIKGVAKKTDLARFAKSRPATASLCWSLAPMA